MRMGRDVQQDVLETGKEPFLSAQGHDAELILGAVVVDRQLPIGDIALQRRPLVGQVPAARHPAAISATRSP